MLGLCEKIADLDRNILSVLLIDNGMVVQQKSRPGVEFVDHDKAESIVVQKLMMLYLSKMHENFRGKFEYTMSRYENADILMLEVPSIKKKSMLVVTIERPYDPGLMDSIAAELDNLVA
jgi:hypothetical protein